MINPYQYPDLSPQVSLMTKEQTLLWNHSRVEFASAFTTRYLGDTKIMGDYFFPHGLTKTPLTILIHGMGDRSVIPCRMIAKDLAKQGIASFILYLVFHTLRAPPSIKTRYPNLSTQEWDESYKISVTDVHQVLDWVGSRPEINQSQISVLGISYGSFITSIAMALDKRLNKGILVECGGNSEKITKHSLLLRWRYRLKPAIYRQNQAAYSRYLGDVARQGWDKVEASKSSYLTDPLTFAGKLRDRPLMLLNASFDEMIPKAATRELWESLGKPLIHWYPATHSSLWIWYPLFRDKITAFLKN
jgi:pimeloyl-ACP methyl ester carboxylesterase